MKRRLVVLKSSTSSSLLPSDLVDQANAQLQRILADRNHGIPQQHSSAKNYSHKSIITFTASPSIRQLPDNIKDWEENLQVQVNPNVQH